MGWGSNLFPLLIVTPSGGFTGLFVYKPAPGSGNLIGSWTAASGTDPFGNPFADNLTVYGPGGQEIHLTNFAGALIQAFVTGAAIEGSAAQISTFAALGGSLLQFSLSGPKSNVAGHTDQIVGLIEAAQNVAGNSANWLFLYLDITGAQHQYAGYDCTGFTIQAGKVDAVDPSTGTLATPAAPESWHTISGGFPAGWTGSIHYKLVGLHNFACVDWNLTIANTTVVTANETIATLPAAYQPTVGKDGSGTRFASGAAGTTQPVRIDTSGNFVQSGAGFTAVSDLSWRGTFIYPLDI